MRQLLASAAVTALIAGPALAGQVIAKEGRFDADVSAKQMSRIDIVGEKIASVRKLDEPSGPSIAVEPDEASGDVFVSFDGDVAAKSFTVFLTTQSGRVVQGVLHPIAAEGQTVFVRLADGGASAPPPAAPQTQRAQWSPTDAPTGAVPRGEGRSPYQETLTQFVRVMWNNQDVEGVTHRFLAGAAMKAGPFSIRQVSAWDAPAVGFHGRVLYLINLGKTDQPVKLEGFLVEHVYADATDHDVLRPGEVGRVFLVEEAR
jgi:hypothetical protein